VSEEWVASAEYTLVYGNGEGDGWVRPISFGGDHCPGGSGIQGLLDGSIWDPCSLFENCSNRRERGFICPFVCVFLDQNVHSLNPVSAVGK
jgi:hypothetical protein